MIRQSITALLAVVSVSLAGTAYGQQSAAAARTTRAAPDPSEVICKDIAVNGLRFGTRRYCGTRAEWQAREQGDRAAVEQMQRPIQVCNIMGTRKC